VKWAGLKKYWAEIIRITGNKALESPPAGKETYFSG
jgi:hypothetical protein